MIKKWINLIAFKLGLSRHERTYGTLNLIKFNPVFHLYPGTIIYCHGGFGKLYHVPDIIKELVTNGYNISYIAYNDDPDVVEPNILNDIDDIRVALHVSDSPIYLMGVSRGAYVALQSATILQNQKINKIIDIVGPVKESWKEDVDPKTREELSRLFPYFYTIPFPFEKLDKIANIPILAVYGKMDNVVPLVQGRAIHDSFIIKDLTYFESNSGHGCLTDDPNVLKYILNFLRSNNGYMA